MLNELCAALGINKSAFLTGLIGGIFSLRWVPQVGWLGILSAVLFAAAVANYATEPVYHWLAIKGLHQGGVGMLIGLFATSSAAAIYKAMGELQLSSLLSDTLRRFTGGARS